MAEAARRIHDVRLLCLREHGLQMRIHGSAALNPKLQTPNPKPQTPNPKP